MWHVSGHIGTMSDVDDCGSNWMPKDGHTRGGQVYKCGGGKRFRPA